MRRLGQILLEQGWVTPEQLLRALNHQKLVGGRLGTCLLEMEAVEERLLLRALALQLGVPAAEAEDLRGVPDEVTELLPPKVARRCQAVPFRLLGGQLHIALLGVRDLAIQDELAFVSGKRLRIHIANEARVFEALEKYYSEECPQRFAQLIDRLNRARYLWNQPQRETPVPTVTPSSSNPWELPPVKPVSAPARENSPLPPKVSEPMPRPSPASAALEETLPPTPPPLPPPLPAPVAALPARVTEGSPGIKAKAETGDPVLAPPPTAPAPKPEAPAPSFEETERRLRDPGDRDEVGEALLGYFGARFRRCVLLALRKDEASGWMGRGEGIDLERLRQYRASLAQPSLFATLREGAQVFRGPLPALPLHRQLVALWGGKLPADVLLLPIAVGGRPAAVIYLESEPDPLGLFDAAELQRLVARAGIALETCIRRQKARQA